MRLFLKYICVFLIFFLTSFLLIVVSNYWLIRLTPVSFPSTKNILILGDSTPECAINDNIFKRSINFSAPAESYYYSYLKLKKILETKQVIDTVLLSFSPHNVFDNNWFSSQNHIQHNFCRYYPIMSGYDFKLLLESHPKSVLYSLRNIVLQFLKNIFRKFAGDNVFPLGGFTNLDLDSLIAALESLESGEELRNYRLPKDFTTTNVELMYIHKTAQLCRERQVKLILITLPKRMELFKHSRYGMKEFHSLYNTEFSQLDYFDFSAFYMSDDMYADLLHLNKKGASYFSNFLQSSSWYSFRYAQ